MTTIDKPQNTSSEENGHVFRLDVRYRNLGLITLPCCLAMAIVSAAAVWLDDQPDRWMPTAFTILFWGSLAALSACLLLAYRREYLIITHDRITHQGIVREKTLRFSDVEAAIWKSQPQYGLIVLRSPASKIKVHLGNFRAEDVLRVIELLREALPKAIQGDWELYCHRVAVPLRERVRQPLRAPKADESLITRRRWDRLFLPTIIVTVIFGCAMGLGLGQPRMLAAPVALMLLWALLRMTIPKVGMISKRISMNAEQRRILWISSFMLALCYALVFLNAALATTFAFALLGWMVFIAHQADRHRQQQDREYAHLTAEKWEEDE